MSESSDKLLMARPPKGVPTSDASFIPAPVLSVTPAERPQYRKRTRMQASSAPATLPIHPNAHILIAKSRFLSKKVASRQSGVVGVSWDASKSAWIATYTLEGKLKRQRFRISPFLQPGVTWKAAEKKARESAIHARNVALNLKGARASKKPGRPQSGIKGVNWDITKLSWKVQCWCTPVRGIKKTKRLFGGYHKPKMNTHAARQEALQKAKEALTQLLEKHRINFVQGAE